MEKKEEEKTQETLDLFQLIFEGNLLTKNANGKEFYQTSKGIVTLEEFGDCQTATLNEIEQRRKLSEVPKPKEIEKMVVAYHFPCLDGAVAAALVQLYAKVVDGDILKIVEAFRLKRRNALENVSGLPPVEVKRKEAPYSSSHFNTCHLPTLKLEPFGYNGSNYLFRIKRHCDPKTVLVFVDTFGADERELELFCGKFKEVWVIDHHLTFKKKVLDVWKDKTPQNFFYIFEDGVSASKIIREIFGKFLLPIETILVSDLAEQFSLFLDYVNDNDLKLEVLKDIEEFIQGFYALELNFDMNMETRLLQKLLELCNPKFLVEKGRPLFEKIQKEVNEIVRSQSQLVTWEGSTRFLAAKCERRIVSQVGNALAVKSFEMGHANIGMAFMPIQRNSSFVCSLRSSNRHPVSEKNNCESIAIKLGGGGHLNAAAFKATKQTMKNSFKGFKIPNN